MTVALALSGLAAWVMAIVLANRLHVPSAIGSAHVTPAARPKDHPAGQELSLTTWNIGYAGMGPESDFVMDKGRQLRPPSADLVDRNLKGIVAEIAGQDADVLLLQEAARPSWNNYRRDVLGAIRRSLPDYGGFFAPDAHTRLLPPPWNLRIGNAILARVPIKAAELRALPLEPTFQWGIFRKSYRMQVARLDRGWVVVNIHLSAFDTEADNVRERQVAEVLRFAQSEYAKGSHVVIGGDWNLRLAANDFPHTTPAAARFWIRDFPQNRVPEGWTWAADPSVPTVRTADKPYVRGENHRLTIDGFLVSPNVEVLEVAGRDLDFQAADHNPVAARFRRRGQA